MAYSNRIQQTLVAQANRMRKMITANFELLPVCNLDCRMCYVRMDMQTVKRKGGLRKPEEWLRLAREMREEGVLFLLLTGGEVFLYPGFRELYEELYQMGFVLTINTNGTLIDESIAKWLKRYPPKCVSISLYGASDETYEALCGRKGMFSKVNHAARTLMEHGIRVEFKTIFTPLNICDLEKCWAYTQRLGVYYETDPYSFPPLRKLEAGDQVRFNAEEVVECRFRNNRMVSSDAQFVRKIVEYLQKYEQTKDKTGCDLYGFTCGATRSSSWITWQGHMTPCAMLEEPWVDVFEEGFAESWEKLKAMSDRILMSSECSHCDKRDVCTTCPASNLAESGSFQKKSEYHCRMTEKTLEDMYRMVDAWGIDIHSIMDRKEEEK